MLNLEGIGKPIIKIVGGKRNNKIVYMDADESPKVKNKYSSIELDDGELFEPLANFKSNRSVSYIAGQSGSGKSYYCKQYIKNLLAHLKEKKPIILFSPFEEDPSLDDLEDIQRVKIDMSLAEDPIDIKELKNSIVIFDDIDSIKLKKKKETQEVKEAIYELLHQCLEIGRHYDIDVVQTNHILCAGNDTKRILNESHNIVFFPHSGSKMSMKRLCEEYGGIDKEALKEIKRIKSRWCCIHRNYPIHISTQKKIWNPNIDEE